MADQKITELPAASIPLNGTEVLPIVQSSTTSQANVQNITDYVSSYVKPYKVYIANLTQAGAGVPSVVVLENTLGGDLTFEYNNTGSFFINASGMFSDASKVVVFANFQSDTNEAGYVFNYVVNSANQIIVNIYNISNVPVSVMGGDGRYCSLEIRIYN